MSRLGAFSTIISDVLKTPTYVYYDKLVSGNQCISAVFLNGRCVFDVQQFLKNTIEKLIIDEQFRDVDIVKCAATGKQFLMSNTRHHEPTDKEKDIINNVVTLLKNSIKISVDGLLRRIFSDATDEFLIPLRQDLNTIFYGDPTSNVFKSSCTVFDRNMYTLYSKQLCQTSLLTQDIIDLFEGLQKKLIAAIKQANMSGKK